MNTATHPHVVLFDGVCNLCNASVQFILRHDHAQRFKFASLQSPEGKKYLQQFHLPELDTVLLISQGKAYTHSTAALEIAKHLGSPYRHLYLLHHIPKALRDAVYRFVAKNRYRLFGKQESCMLPTPETADRFL